MDGIAADLGHQPSALCRRLAGLPVLTSCQPDSQWQSATLELFPQGPGLETNLAAAIVMQRRSRVRASLAQSNFDPSTRNFYGNEQSVYFWPLQNAPSNAEYRGCSMFCSWGRPGHKPLCFMRVQHAQGGSSGVQLPHPSCGPSSAVWAILTIEVPSDAWISPFKSGEWHGCEGRIASHRKSVHYKVHLEHRGGIHPVYHIW
ncbi:hypothetical protein CISG_05549 [Coccidioides immitis RMSCC 3703]|uniref:Uncharacterized protein n=1 Tax=Coccidioides immitis RMSCC 3703 TaxID=454286 RepID=A0A0J8QUN7_COCIT|nr:hypothetical protein CISG_05549 [Coccidioides immitis RMSCC 3703]